jgi:hypothetical protein
MKHAGLIFIIKCGEYHKEYGREGNQVQLPIPNKNQQARISSSSVEHSISTKRYQDAIQRL